MVQISQKSVAVLLQPCLFAFVCIFQVLFVKASNVHGTEKVRDGLVVTWGFPDVDDPWTFNHLPKTVSDAKKQNWTLLDDGCTDKSLGFIGERYIWNSEVDILLIFDKSGHVAGIQIALSQSVFDQNEAYDAATYPVLHHKIFGEGYYVMTAYFVAKETVCNGRTNPVQRETITKLWFINGTDSLTNPVYEPLTENQELAESSWTREKCYPTMGQHYYRNFYKDMDCASTRPFGPLYEENKIIGFNFLFLGNFTSNRFEHPPRFALPS